MSIMEETTKEIVASAVKVSPPAGVSGAILFGVPLEKWVMVLTIVYTLIQIFLLLRDRVFHRGGKSSEGDAS